MTTDEQLAEAPPGSEPRSRRPWGPLTFLQPQEEPQQDSPLPSPSPSPETATEPLPDLSELSPSDSGSPLDEYSEPSEPDPSSSSTSSGSTNPFAKLGKASLKATSRKAVLIASGMAHRIAAQSELQRANGLYLADDEDAQNIGDPIADILGRRGGVAGKAMSPDTADAISALMGLAGYASKQFALTMAIRQHEAAQHSQPPTAADV